MTDLEIMLAMLARAKIEFERKIVPPDCARAGNTMLTIERGYYNFVSVLFFEPSGELASIEAYE